MEEAAVAPTSKKTKKPSLTPNKSNRLVSLDVYRGVIMILLASEAFGIADTAKKILADSPDSSLWQNILYQFSHVPWGGITIWDMIQPSFMFMVGVSMPFSYGKRKKADHTYWQSFLHAAWRGVVLVLLGVFLRSMNQPSTNWFFMDVLSQIGLGYIFLFLLWDRSVKIQLAAFLVILVGYWSFFAFWSLPDADFDPASVGVKKQFAEVQYEGFEAHWNMNTNPGHDFEVWLLNAIPRANGKPFEFSSGGYVTLNFIPALATMIMGLMAGGLLYSEMSSRDKFLLLFMSGLLCIGIGFGLEYFGFCPIVKRIWTPSWAIYSGGFCLVILSFFYLVVDIIKLRWLFFPAVVVGMNSIMIYFMGWTMHRQTTLFLKRHFGENIFQLTWVESLFPAYDPTLYEPMVRHTAVFLVFWLVLYWMYRSRLFVRV